MAQVSGTGRGKNLRSTKTQKTAFAVGLLVAILGGIFVTWSPSAGALGAATTPITDYENYPSAITPALIPDGCETTGSTVLTGQSYSKNGEPGVGDLSALSLVPGDTIAMTWTGFAENCSGIGVTLSAKKTQHNTFKPFTNQALVDHFYCGPGGQSCGSGPYGPLTLSVPSTQTACNFQIDATIGPPLAVVGPLGSYYSSTTRGDNGKPFGTINDPDMLISAIVGGQETCFEPPSATAVASCTAASNGPGFDVSIANNDDDQNAIVDVKKGTTVVNDDLSVPFPQPPAPLPNIVHVLVPFTNGETATVSVVDVANNVVIFSQEFTANCVDLGATITHSCADGGVKVDFTNTGTESATLTVTKGGVVIDTVTVTGGGTASRTYPMAEDETATYRVTGTDFDSGDTPFTHDCVLAESTTTTTAPPTTVPDTVAGSDVARSATLPRTGASSTLPMSTMAGLLLITGGLLLALANRPMPTPSTARTRSRGR